MQRKGWNFSRKPQSFRLKMKALKAFLILCGLHQVYSRYTGSTSSKSCSDADPNTLTIFDDPDSCGSFIVCVDKLPRSFKCFEDGFLLSNNGSTVCVACDEVNDEFYEYDDDNPYGQKTTRKKFTYKQTRRTKATTRDYGHTTKQPKYSKILDFRTFFQFYFCSMWIWALLVRILMWQVTFKKWDKGRF